ncbi:MAG: hypothetical protein O3C09_00780 [Proteobacteria bacterium]|nr:hypothetical protein [Pseudomonadota bacterium]
MKAALARAVGASSFDGLRDEVAALQASTYVLFQDRIERPAANLPFMNKDEEPPETN